MLRKRVRSAFERLFESFNTGADEAYERRDAAYEDSDAEAYAAGEAHAYGDAADQVREAQAEEAE